MTQPYYQDEAVTLTTATASRSTNGSPPTCW